MPTFNNFVEGLTTQLVNTGLRKVAGNLPGTGKTTRYGGSDKSDYRSLRPQPNVQNFTFPLDVESGPGMGNQGHYMMFFINQQNHAKLHFGGKNNSARPDPTTSATNDNLDMSAISKLVGGDLSPGRARAQFGSISARNNAVKVGMRRAPTTRLATAISMYMPSTVTTGYSSQYTDTEIGFVAAGAINAYEKFAQGSMRGGLNEIGNLDAGLAKAITGMMLTTVGALPGFSGLKAAAEMKSGVVLSDRMELAFKGIDKRTFQYEFKMSPKSEAEANEIKEIINAFKVNMLPEYEGSDQHGRALIVPNTFDIKYMYNGNENSFLHKISTCVLESMNVSYGGDKYKTHAGTDEGAPPVETSLTLTFKELELITREKATEGF